LNLVSFRLPSTITKLVRVVLRHSAFVVPKSKIKAVAISKAIGPEPAQEYTAEIKDGRITRLGCEGNYHMTDVRCIGDKHLVAALEKQLGLIH
jgi:hypothetical protein